ncbi:radical SAM protein [uncultured Desulfobacter sp.]|uniref:radical SAM protein n=1 Tax=uncultured Desulfobacter sp. TaxID=240139 RepID=UPI0029C71D53|nr:radical SAM protein [uncultured Desulfobacter sp.]
MDLSNHPCFNAKMKGIYGRVHLPVAPRCNIQCNYCDRKYDCVNESRPGVTSAVLKPSQAMIYLDYVLEKVKNISVVGIAGPGDPFANPDETMETLQMVHRQYPEIILCLATNGLGIGPYIDDLAEMNLRHVTITLNAIDPEIGSQLYAFVRHGKRTLGPKPGFEVLLEKQLEAIIHLKEKNITTKVNTVIIPGINDGHIEAIAEKMAELKVDVLNCIPFYPNKGSNFGHLKEPSKSLVKDIRKKAEKHIPQMYHCKRCRADAVGILGEENGRKITEKLQECAQMPEIYGDKRPYVAAASLDGRLVNQHLGKAEELLIYGQEDNGDVYFVEARKTPKPGGGKQRWEDLSDMLSDCRALMVTGLGDSPRRILSQKKIDVLELDGTIAEAAEAAFEGHSMDFMVQRDVQACNKKNPMAGIMGCGF